MRQEYLLRLLAGTLPRTAGEIFLRGSPITGPRRDIGIVFQTATLLPWRNVLANTLLPVDVQGLDKQTYTERAHRLLQMVGLSGFERNTRPNSRAACSSASRSRVPWCTTPRCS